MLESATPYQYRRRVHYEYKVEHTDVMCGGVHAWNYTAIEARLNELAHEGWRCIDVVGQNRRTFIFEREYTPTTPLPPTGGPR